ncbi:mitochondrial intermembrane space import and assembly protein 40-B [Odontomachus brunneus]|uniref:mitochondrial intermembrane space import and assembly protein 40-B n=1 Tax=Odontomachus brunneus TaxID=486640 RepID=UPI0013F1C5AB|nr:mitochondrial intermembrane space import and assembly protein 40-B [Odontomachus brunneus]
MPSIHKEGKDTIIFASKEDHANPSNIDLPPPEPNSLLVLSNGEINWNCPCLGGMATGPCGLEFREAFSCFHFSSAEPKGSDCYEAFKTMQTCMSQYPALYESKGSMDDLVDDDDDEEDEQAAKAQSTSADNKEKRNAMSAIQDDAKRNPETLNLSSTKQQVEQAKTN